MFSIVIELALIFYYPILCHLLWLCSEALDCFGRWSGTVTQTHTQQVICLSASRNEFPGRIAFNKKVRLAILLLLQCICNAFGYFFDHDPQQDVNQKGWDLFSTTTLGFYNQESQPQHLFTDVILEIVIATS